MASNDFSAALSILRLNKFMIWNLNYLLWVFLPGLLIGLWAQWRLHSAFGKYSQVPVESGMTGAQTARRILDSAGLTDVPVEEVAGQLTDHYDPTKRALFCRRTITAAIPSPPWAWRRTRPATRCNIRRLTRC